MMRKEMIHVFLTMSILLLLACTDDEKGTTNPINSDAGSVAGSMAGTQSAAGTNNPQAGVTAGTSTSMQCMTSDDCLAPQGCNPSSQMCEDSCNTHDDCDGNRVCLNSFCQSAPSCNESTPCVDGFTCNCDNLCVPQIGATCNTPLQCTTQEYCNECEKQCKPKVAPCEACQSSDSCERSADICTSLGSEQICLRGCTGQGSCDNLGPGYTCQMIEGDDTNTYCVPSAGSCSALTGCSTDQECPAGEFCNERQQCQPGCIDDTSCAGGLLCQGLRCGPPCTTNDDCAASAECQADGHCKIPGGCQSSRDCLEAETYCDLNTLMCVDGCQVDDDCLNASQVCDNGSCVRRGCEFNYQCSFGEVCDVASATCVMAEGRHCEMNCDPMNTATSCGDTGQRCLSLQDEDENPLGDFCFEPCQAEPNACPQGYTCTPIPDPENMQSEISLCFRDCSANLKK